MVARLSLLPLVCSFALFSACETGPESIAAHAVDSSDLSTIFSQGDNPQEDEFLPSAYRITKLELRDPHPFAGALFLCIDATDQVNGQIESRIAADENADGFIDLGLSVVFRPLAQEDTSSPVEVHVSKCSMPAESTSCETGPESVVSEAQNVGEGVCLTPIVGTVDYEPAPTEPEGPCFYSVPVDMHVELAGLAFTLEGAQVAATYTGNPATGLTSGLLMGFLDEKAAENILIPESIPFVGGKKLASLFPGGKGNCSSDDARDIGPDGVKKGWWMYLNFEAAPVPWTDVVTN